MCRDTNHTQNVMISLVWLVWLMLILYYTYTRKQEVHYAHSTITRCVWRLPLDINHINQALETTRKRWLVWAKTGAHTNHASLIPQ